MRKREGKPPLTRDEAQALIADLEKIEGDFQTQVRQNEINAAEDAKALDLRAVI